MSYHNPFTKKLLTSVTAGAGVVNPSETNGRTNHTFYIYGEGTVSAGAVIIETAPDEDYAGTWDPIETASTVVADTVIAVQATGAFLALRARVSTTVEGEAGAVSVEYIGAE